MGNVIIPWWASGGVDLKPNFTLADLGLVDADVKIWIDANDPSKVSKDANGFITSFADKSSNGRDFTGSPTATTGLKVVSGELGDLSYLETISDDTFDWIVTDNSDAENNLAQPNVVYILAKAKTATTGYFWDSYHQSQREYLFWNSVNATLNTPGPGSQAYAQTEFLEWHLYKGIYDGSSSHIKVDNVSSTDSTFMTFNAATLTMRGTSLFNRSTTESAAINGYIAQFLVCDDLSAAKQDSVDSFFDTYYSAYYGT